MTKRVSLIARQLLSIFALVAFVGLLTTSAAAQVEGTPQLPVAKDAAVPSGVYQQFTAKEFVALSTMALVDPDLGKTTAVVYVHRLPKGTDITKVANELAPKLADGSVRPLWVPNDTNQGNARFTLPPNQDGLSQLKYLAQRRDGEIGLVSFDKKITSAVNTMPSKWISWDTSSVSAAK